MSTALQESNPIHNTPEVESAMHVSMYLKDNLPPCIQFSILFYFPNYLLFLHFILLWIIHKNTQVPLHLKTLQCLSIWIICFFPFQIFLHILLHLPHLCPRSQTIHPCITLTSLNLSSLLFHVISKFSKHTSVTSSKLFIYTPKAAVPCGPQSLQIAY